jgi:hypothetical protein
MTIEDMVEELGGHVGTVPLRKDWQWKQQEQRYDHEPESHISTSLMGSVCGSSFR